MADELGKDAFILQVEVTIPVTELDKHQKILRELAKVIGAATGNVHPVVTDLGYKFNINTLSDSARLFSDMLYRSAAPSTKRRIELGEDFYRRKMGLTEKDGFDADSAMSSADSKSGRVSHTTISIMTRAEIIASFDELDTAGIEERIEWALKEQNWIIFCVDAPDGLLKTRKGILKHIDNFAENAVGKKLNTTMDDTDTVAPDILVFSRVHKFIDYLSRCDIIDPIRIRAGFAEAEVDEPTVIAPPSRLNETLRQLSTAYNESLEDSSAANVPISSDSLEPIRRRQYTREELMDILEDRTPVPNFNILNWIHEDGSVQSHRKDVLNQFANLLFKARDASEADLRYATYDVQRFLINALKEGHISEYMGRVCANYIHSDVGHKIEVVLEVPEPTQPSAVIRTKASKTTFTDEQIYDMLSDTGIPFRPSENGQPASLRDLLTWLNRSSNPEIKKYDSFIYDVYEKMSLLSYNTNVDGSGRLIFGATKQEAVHEIQRSLIAELKKGLPEQAVREISRFMHRYINRSILPELDHVNPWATSRPSPQAKQEPYSGTVPREALHSILFDREDPYRVAQTLPMLDNMRSWIVHDLSASEEPYKETIQKVFHALLKANETPRGDARNKAVYDVQRMIVGALEDGLPESAARECVRFTRRFLGNAVAPEFLSLWSTTSVPDIGR